MNTDVVWSIIIFLGIGMVGVAWIIYYILKMATDELNVPLQNQEDH
jgi:hypothetical protein